MKKTKKILLIVIILLLILLIALIGMCRSYSSKYLESDTLPDNVFINGIDCSEMTKKDARKKLVNEWNSNCFEITSQGECIESIPLSGMKYTITENIRSCISDAGFFAYLRHLAGKPYEISIPMTVRSGGKAFNSEYKAFCDRLDEGTTHTEDAYVDMSTADFNVVAEIYGDNVDRKLLRSSIYSMIAEGTMTLDYNRDDFIDVPDITTDSREIEEQLEYCNTYLKEKITYEFGGSEITITPAELNDMIYLTESGDVAVDSKKVREYVDRLAYDTDTYGSNRVFRSTNRGDITVYGGAYGYLIDRDAETKHLSKDLISGNDVTREPEYIYRGNGRNGRDDIGSTYLEIDLSAQKLWYYQSGRIIFTSEFVSGNLKDGTGTIVGTYSLAYKERDATLKGENVDGTDYESEVKYWMPFWNGYGLHDAPWRDEFGGTIYKTNGSHGCINLPPEKAEQLFSIIKTHDIIVIYY